MAERENGIKISIPYLSVTKLALYIMAQLLESLDFIIEMFFFFQVNLLSIKTLKNV